MRLKLERKVLRGADEIFRAAVALAVAESGGGMWMDGARPVDVEAIRTSLDAWEAENAGKLDPRSAPDLPTPAESESVGDDHSVPAVREGSVAWRARQLQVSGSADALTGTLRIAVEPAGPGMSVVSVRANVGSRRRSFRLALFVGGPVIRRIVRKHVASFDDQWLDGLTAFPLVHHSSDTWTFQPESLGELSPA